MKIILVEPTLSVYNSTGSTPKITKAQQHLTADIIETDNKCINVHDSVVDQHGVVP